jgi:hypothetical protein
VGSRIVYHWQKAIHSFGRGQKSPVFHLTIVTNHGILWIGFRLRSLNLLRFSASATELTLKKALKIIAAGEERDVG